MTLAVAMMFEAVLVISAVAGLVAALVGVVRARGWVRLGWILVAGGFAWIVVGETVLQLTGSTQLIVRWPRSLPARPLIAIGLWFVVWALRRRR